ncbi:hypothetical protein N0V93_008457 [Gnomoniopsis smithogilvyi]|uniref:Uncharacterized protein n=1 Tax=Gnomoniopsis smithogilvyi TaxID=1191159 RepID=A0A9W8YN11_9PEZI|nr:hypothetical protein N0V93_008457 [Gnomoniopsis smithogilvyi]
MGLAALDSDILLPISSTPPGNCAEADQSDELSALTTIKSKEVDDVIMLDIPSAFDHKDQGLYEGNMNAANPARDCRSDHFHGSSSSHGPFNKMETLALQQRVESDAFSRPATPVILGTGADPVKGFHAESDVGMDVDKRAQPQPFIVGMVSIPEVDLNFCDFPPTEPYLFGPDGVSTFNSIRCLPFRNDILPIVDKSPSVRVFLADISRVEQTEQQDTVHREQMAPTQQRVLSLQSQAQIDLQDAKDSSRALTRMLQEDQSQPADQLETSAQICEMITRAVRKAKAAEIYVRSGLQRATSSQEAQALERQAEDAKQLVQEMAALLQRNHQRHQQIWTRATQQSPVPQQIPPVQPQMLQQNREPVQLMAQAHSTEQLQPIALAPPTAQVQDSTKIHDAIRQVQQALATADQTVWGYQQSWAQIGAQIAAQQHATVQQGQAQQEAYPQQHLYHSQQHGHAQQQVRQAQQAQESGHAPQPFTRPQHPQEQATSGLDQHPVVTGQLFAAQLRHDDRPRPSTRSPRVEQEVEALQETDSCLRGGCSGHDRDAVSNDNSQDVQQSQDAAESDSPPMSARQFQRVVGNSAAASVHQRTLISAPSPPTTVPSTPRRLDPKVEGMDDANLDAVVLEKGMKSDTMTREEKMELAQDDLDMWREEQRRRLRATLHPSPPTTVPSTPRRLDTKVEAMDDANLDAVVLEKGMKSDTMTREEKMELAQDDLDMWRTEQRRRLRATLHPDAQSDPASVLQRQLTLSNKPCSSKKVGLSAWTQYEKNEQARLMKSRVESGRNESRYPSPVMHTRKGSAPQAVQKQSKQHGHSHCRTSQVSAQSDFSKLPAAGLLKGASRGPQEKHGRNQQHYRSYHGSHLGPEANSSRSPFAEIVDETTKEVLAPGPGRCGIDKHGHVLAQGPLDYQKLVEEAALEDCIVQDIQLDDLVVEELDEKPAVDAKGCRSKQQD